MGVHSMVILQGWHVVLRTLGSLARLVANQLIVHHGVVFKQLVQCAGGRGVLIMAGKGDQPVFCKG
jgi:hypothetical protein